MKDLQKSNKMSIYSKIILHMPFPAMISLLVYNQLYGSEAIKSRKRSNVKYD